MKHKVGDRVAFKRDDAFISGSACAAFGIDFINSLDFKDCKFYKGKITKIKTRVGLFIKLEKPLYLIDDYYFTTEIKPLITVKAR